MGYIISLRPEKKTNQMPRPQMQFFLCRKAVFFPTYDEGLCLSNGYAEILQYKLLKYRIRTENV
jgi:hypothetical protein